MIQQARGEDARELTGHDMAEDVAPTFWNHAAPAQPGEQMAVFDDSPVPTFASERTASRVPSGFEISVNHGWQQKAAFRFCGSARRDLAGECVEVIGDGATVYSLFL